MFLCPCSQWYSVSIFCHFNPDTETKHLIRPSDRHLVTLQLIAIAFTVSFDVSFAVWWILAWLAEEDASYGNEVLSDDPAHLIQDEKCVSECVRST